MIRRAPQLWGYTQSRWTLALLAEQCAWLAGLSLPGICQLLSRLGISYKRSRDYVHSPDPYYWPKLDLVEQMRLRTYYAAHKYAFLYLDEVTYYRQPTAASAYELQGAQQPLAYRSHAANTTGRIVAALDAMTGQVLYRQQSRTDVNCLVNFWYDLRHAYPSVTTIYVVVDNWPMHFHPDVLASLQEQNLPWPPRLSPSWPTEPSPKAKQDDLPIQLLCLPTYASWLNPIEKLWRWLKQDVLHLHRLSDDWPALKRRIAAFLDQFRDGSTPLLRYTGLLPI